MCGVDGITYRSMCELRQKSCKIGKSIQLAYSGPCTGNEDIFFIAFLCFQIIFGNQDVDKKKNRLISILIDSIVATMSFYDINIIIKKKIYISLNPFACFSYLVNFFNFCLSCIFYFMIMNVIGLERAKNERKMNIFYFSM